MTKEIILLFASSLFISLSSLTGVIFVWKKLGDWAHEHLFHLVSFSAGVFLLVTLHLTEETLELSGSIWLTLLYIAIGVGIVGIISLLFPEGHHHHKKNDCKDSHSLNGARRILVGDAIHNIADGVLLAPAFLVDIRLGVITALGVLIHEVVQEVSEFFVLREAGYSINGALARNFIVSTTIIIGAALGLALTDIESLVAPLIGIAAGIFFYIVVLDLIPKSVHASLKAKKRWPYLLWGTFGILVILGLNLIAHV